MTCKKQTITKPPAIMRQLRFTATYVQQVLKRSIDSFEVCRVKTRSRSLAAENFSTFNTSIQNFLLAIFEALSVQHFENLFCVIAV